MTTATAPGGPARQHDMGVATFADDGDETVFAHEPIGGGVRHLGRDERLMLGLALLGAAPMGFLIAKVGLLPVVALIGIATIGLFTRRPQFAVLGALPIAMLLNPFVEVLPLGALGCLIPFGVWVVLRRVGVLGPTNAPKLLPAVFVGWLAMSYYLFTLPGYSNPDRQGSMIQLVGAIALLFGAAALRPRPVDLVRVAGVSIALAAIASLLTAGRDNEGRIVALNLNTNYLGALMAMGVLACASSIVATKRNRWLVPMIPMAVVIVQTHSRGTLLSLGAGLVVLLSFLSAKTRVLAVLIAAFGLAFLPILEDFGKAKLLGNRNSESFNNSNELRSAVLSDAVRLTLRHPVTGVGYGMFQPRSRENPRVGKPLNSHNDYLRLSSETGVIGLALFVALVGAPFFRRRSQAYVLLVPILTSFLVSTLDANILASVTVSVPFWAMAGTLWTVDRPESWRSPEQARTRASHRVPAAVLPVAS